MINLYIKIKFIIYKKTIKMNASIDQEQEEYEYEEEYYEDEDEYYEDEEEEEEPIERIDIKEKQGQHFSFIDSVLASKIDEFIKNPSMNSDRKYTILKSQIGKIMLSPVEEYIDHKFYKTMKIVQINVFPKFQRLGVCRKMLEFVQEKVKEYQIWDKIIVECVQNKHLYQHLQKQGWDLVAKDQNSFVY